MVQTVYGFSEPGGLACQYVKVTFKQVTPLVLPFQCTDVPMPEQHKLPWEPAGQEQLALQTA